MKNSKQQLGTIGPVDEFIEIEGSEVKAKRSLHESGRPMIVFRPFRPSVLSSDILQNILETARVQLGRGFSIVRVYLESDQSNERSLLEQLGFALDGIKFGIQIETLRQRLSRRRWSLPDGLHVSAMDYTKDIADVVALEKLVHVADPSSRVNFETDESIEGMRGYYKKVCGGKGVNFVAERN